MTAGPYTDHSTSAIQNLDVTEPPSVGDFACTHIAVEVSAISVDGRAVNKPSPFPSEEREPATTIVVPPDEVHALGTTM
jgi:hypothetical protein